MTTAPRVIAERPTPGTPRSYEFPAFTRQHLENGLTVIAVHLPGRPLASASIVFRAGAADEPAGAAGATVLAGRALPEGTERYDAIELVEASERLGASLHAEAGWDAFSAGVEVPVARLEPALELLAEMVANPTFPEAEVDRLREERLNDLLQARADPRRRADEAFAATIYRSSSPYHRPAGGTRETVERLGREAVRAAYARVVDPSKAALILAGDLGGVDVAAVVQRLFGGLRAGARAGETRPIPVEAAVARRLVKVVHRPGAVQTEIRIGHPGLPRRIPDFHAVSVMSAILGGLFASRLNMKLREEKGYTYGASAGFDLRRAAGPFAARAAVNAAVTVPAVVDALAELERMHSGAVTDDEVRAARDFLIGVFPLRFETPGPIVAALSGLFTHQLPDDELARYRAAIEAVTPAAVDAAARAHLHLERAAVVLVGDAETIEGELVAAGLGPVVVERDEGPVSEGPAEGVEDELGPVDGGEGGPAEGADEPPEDPVGGDEASDGPPG